MVRTILIISIHALREEGDIWPGLPGKIVP